MTVVEGSTSSSSSSNDVPTIRALQRALELVADSVNQFDASCRAWAAYHQSGPTAITGPAWEAYKHASAQNVVSIRGVRGVKQLIQKEAVWLQRHAEEMGSSDVKCSSSNAFYICTLWHRALYILHRRGQTITELDASFALSEQKVQRLNRPAKVDIVSQGGQRWSRISTLKPHGLLSEFRAAESDLAAFDDDDGEEQRQGIAIEEMDARLQAGELDVAAGQSSIVKLARQLEVAAKHFEHVSPTTFGRPTIELTLTRLPLAVTPDFEGKFYNGKEKARYEARLRAIVNECTQLNVDLLFADSASLAGEWPSDTFGHIVQGIESAPALPLPPTRFTSLTGTPTLHLDLSALIAFVSHVSHMPFPGKPEEAEGQFSKVHWRQEESGRETDNQNGNGNTESCESAEDGVVEGGAHDLHEQGVRDQQHARALGEQLRREMTDDCFFDVLLRHIESFGVAKLRLTCTREAREKMADIVKVVGGYAEQRRASQLFDVRGGEASGLWHGSRWAGSGERERKVRERIALPVQVLDDENVFKQSSRAPSQDIFDDAFVTQALRSLDLGISTLDLPVSSVNVANPAVQRQTRHTLASMQSGLHLGQTTLTTNISSVRWLMRDIARMQTQEGETSSIGASQENDKKPFKAALWVMYPRSLAEKMTLSTSSESVGALAENEITPAESSHSNTQSWSKIGLKDSTLSDPALITILPRERNGFDAHGRTHSPGPRSRIGRKLNAFLRGPRPRATLSIKHYKWWPFRPVEDFWLKVTAPIAWKDPSSSLAITGNMYFGRDVERAFEDQRRPSLPENDDRDGDAWWKGIKQDVRLNWLHWIALAVTLIGWVLGFSFLCKSLWYEGSVIASDGTRSDTSFYGCTSTFWLANSQCGFDGQTCAPFSASLPYDFRCPANCQTTTLGGPRAVGDQLPSYVPLVVGGGNLSSSSSSSSSSSLAAAGTPYIYRGDSFICSAAIHAGILPQSRGGCGRLWLNGAYSGYDAINRFGIASTSFNSTFPLSYYFDATVDDEYCEDNRSQGYILNVLLLAFVGFVLRPKSIVYFYTLVCVGFWHINFLSEPRDYPMSVGSIMGDFLPTLFVSYALWRLNFRFTFPAFRHVPLEATIWTQGLFWIGVMMNLVFANVPLNRLVARDLADQPGALTSLIVIIIIVIILAINQIRVIRKTGFLPKYLTLAIVGGILIALLAAVPTTGIRLHHYIIALVLLPFCAFETRLSLLYSSFLLGMFLNGVGRWGYDGIIQDEATILGSATSGSSIPSFLPASNWTGVVPFANATTQVEINDANVNDLALSMTGKVYWDPVPANQSDSWNAFQLLVDDVLRLQANQTSFDLAQIVHDYLIVNATTTDATSSSSTSLSSSSSSTSQSFDMTNAASVAANYTFYPGGGDSTNILQTLVDQPHYLRLAYYNTITGDLGDFTRAATVWFNGTFITPLPGAT